MSLKWANTPEELVSAYNASSKSWTFLCVQQTAGIAQIRAHDLNGVNKLSSSLKSFKRNENINIKIVEHAENINKYSIEYTYNNNSICSAPPS